MPPFFTGEQRIVDTVRSTFLWRLDVLARTADVVKRWVSIKNSRFLKQQLGARRMSLIQVLHDANTITVGDLIKRWQKIARFISPEGFGQSHY
jgi:hypothetical protein